MTNLGRIVNGPFVVLQVAVLVNEHQLSHRNDDLGLRILDRAKIINCDNDTIAIFKC